MMAHVLGVFYVFGGVAGLFAALGAGPAGHGRESLAGLSLLALGSSVVALRWGRRWPRHAFHVPIASAAALIIVATLVSPDPATAVVCAGLMSFVVIDVYFFFSFPLASVHAVMWLSGVTAGLMVQGEVALATALGLDAAMVALGTVVRGLVLRASSASSDPLTGLANRRGFDDALQEALATVSRTGERLAAALLDVDHFKQINDSSGHEAGDLVLCRIADVWRRELPAGAVFSRHGGDEFALLLPGFTGPQALDLVRRVAAAHPEISLSIGVAEHHRDQRAADLMRHADRALYEAKAAGRGRAELEGGAGDALAPDLAAALAAGDIEVHYQPIVALRTGAVVGVEALARWDHPERGPIGPTEFVAVAEQNGLIRELGHHVLRTACAELAGVQTSEGLQITLGVNVSGRELNDPGCAQRVQQVLAETGFPADHLVLEVTESLVDGESPAAVATLHQLRAAGLKVSIDDFGTGYSSLSRLDTLPADVLKLDRSFIATLDSSPRRAQMLRSLVAMCAALGLDVVAEGVETAKQEAAVGAVGCTFAQGWRYGRAVPLTAFCALLAASGDQHAVPA